MKLLGMLCPLIGHKRDSRRVWQEYGDFRSYCKRCGVPMERGIHGWQVIDDN